MQHQNSASLTILCILSAFLGVNGQDSVAKTVSDPNAESFKYILVPLNSVVRLACAGENGNVSWTSPSLSKTSLANREREVRIQLEDNGTLTIRNVSRDDGGFYWCTRDDKVTRSVWHVMIEPWFRHNLEMESITYGWYAALGTLVLGITVGIMKIIVRLCCPQCHARASTAARVRATALIVGLETYRVDQSTRLRENYNAQVAKLKESCALQMEGLRDHYGTKMTRFRSYIPSYPLGNFREQYSQQVARIRDYSSVNMEKLQDNYAKNLGKLRTYSVVQLERFRQQYQLQHKHMVKILEAMNFNIENCRYGGDMTPGDSVDLNMDFSIANLQMEPSDVRRDSSGSITIDPAASQGITVHAECVERPSCDYAMDGSSLNYVTPPSGTPVLELESTPLDPNDPVLRKAFDAVNMKQFVRRRTDSGDQADSVV